MHRTLWVAALSAAFPSVASANTGDVSHMGSEPAWIITKSRIDSEPRLAKVAAGMVARLEFPVMDVARIDAVRRVNASADNKMLQVGIDRDTRSEAGVDGSLDLQWQRTADGGQASRFAIRSPGALAIRLGLKFATLPDGAELRVLTSTQDDQVMATDGSVQIERAQLEQPIYWTAVSEGDTQMVELYLPVGVEAAALRFTVANLAHLFVSPFGSLAGAKIGESMACEIDSNCVSNPSQAFLNAKSSVARMLFQSGGGSAVCTGTLLNDTDTGTQIPNFYSANHCISTQSVASTLTTFWFEESTSCGSGIASARTQVSGGAALLYNDPATDSLLLRLNNSAPSGAAYGGWDANAIAAGTSIVVIHHPAGDVKKVSLGQTKGFAPYNGAGSFISVGYSTASTEGGSSGSGLLTFADGQYSLRGGLFGGSASCSNTGNVDNPGNDDSFSRFDLVFPNIRQFLAPAAPSAITISAGLKGTWTTPGIDGQGWILDIDPTSRLFVAGWYTATVSGTALDWFTLVGNFSGSQVGLTVLRNAGVRFATPTTVTPAPFGTATMNFTSCSAGSFSYSLGDGRSGTLAMARLTPVPAECR